MADEIIELLKNEKLRTTVIKEIDEVYDMALWTVDRLIDDDHLDKLPDEVREFLREAHDRLQKELEDMDAEKKLTLDEKWHHALFDPGFGLEIEQAFQQHVINRMSRPARITLDDITSGFLLLAKPIQCRSAFPDRSQVPDWESVYAVFLSYVQNHLLSHKRLPAFEVCRSPTKGPLAAALFYVLWRARRRSKDEIAKLAKELTGKTGISPESQRLLSVLPKFFEQPFCWSSANGIEVRFSWGRAEGRWRYVVAEVEGCMSAAASELLQSEMTHLLKSIVKSVSLLEPCSDGWEPGEPLDRGLPALDEDTLRDQEAFVRACLDAFYTKPAKKDSIDRRIHNAVHLLMEADAQSNDALGLALSVSAMEALLGKDKTEISEKLSTDVAVLLEPESERRHAAKKFIKDLYDGRSDALHGKELQKDEHVREQARLLAGGILRAMVTRREFRRKLGYEPEDPEDLLKELRGLCFRPGQTVGVNEPNVRKLWEESHD
ncbi:MAG TPA: HEPN domain-containing protein [Sedimentisphaerales bacterium]|nr:HEPN domain-containing protein [Sedimentisphaerales bacterium]HRS12582.1 HEPN domain-containing protein [Sedimentisphaerales bacterium]HRV49220.1 HEPN domain-containing protein [Sedimentisphaerales bacterium]